MSKDKLYAHAFNLLPQIGPKRLMLLHGFFGNFEKAFKASRSKLERSGLPQETVKIFLEHREALDLQNESDNLEKENIELILLSDINYPTLLREIAAFPPVLYLKGRMEDSDELMLGVVGTRTMTNYGRIVVPLLLEPLIRAGLTIVSGLAFGVDAAAHTAAVERGGRTIAVLGCGLDEGSLYPKEHRLLAQQILQNGGALLSEHPPGRPALKQNFVARNRIISGMSVGTLVVECGAKSGALITANHALEQDRQVYAVPGPVYSQESQGPNNLLKMGAKCVTSANDILTDLNITPKEYSYFEKNIEPTAEERRVLDLLSLEPVPIDEVVKKLGLAAGEVSAQLVLMEMKGLVKNLGGQQYVLARKI